jgi:hypothetical protein
MPQSEMRQVIRLGRRRQIIRRQRRDWMERLTVLAIILIVVNGSVARSQPTDFHARCATEAQKLFQEAGHDGNINPLVSPIAPVSRHYQSHYNTQLKKCLMLLEENQYVANQIVTSATLIDTDDRYLYAFYLMFGARKRRKEGCKIRRRYSAMVVGSLMPSSRDIWKIETDDARISIGF